MISPAKPSITDAVGAGGRNTRTSPLETLQIVAQRWATLCYQIHDIWGLKKILDFDNTLYDLILHINNRRYVDDAYTHVLSR